VVVLHAIRPRRRGANAAGKLIRVGRARYEVEPGTVSRVRVTLGKKARRLLTRSRRTRGQATLVGEGRSTRKIVFVRKR
jgi:hypothetical protein